MFFLLSWSLISLAIFAVGTLMHYLGSPTTEEGWALYWLIMTWVTYVYACLGTVWLAVGAAINMKDLFRRLRSAQRNDRDDGMVVGHHEPRRSRRGGFAAAGGKYGGRMNLASWRRTSRPPRRRTEKG